VIYCWSVEILKLMCLTVCCN